MIAVLMNTRGLVELIVLNLGVDSGVLNKKVFTVMIIMCLFTTFLTCPLVEFIFPESIRVHYLLSATDEDQSKRKVPGDEPADDIESTSYLLNNLQQDANLTIVVDKIEDISGILDVSYLFAPQSSDGSLSVTTVRFVEPSNSAQDRFIPMNAQGRLLLIENMEDLNLTGNHMPELIPVISFCSTIGAYPLNATKVSGDPSDFPDELRDICDLHRSNFVLIPWRSGQFLETFFWGTAQKITLPIGIIVPLESSKNLGSIKDESTSRRLSLRNLSCQRRGITSVLVVVSGCEGDVTAIDAGIRFSVNNRVKVHLAFPKNVKSFRDDIRSKIKQFKQLMSSRPNLSCVQSDFNGTDIHKFVLSVCDDYGLIICGFSEPIDVDEELSIEVEPEPKSPQRKSISLVSTRSRSASMNWTPAVTEQIDLLEYRTKILRLPRKLAAMEQEHVELGILGNNLILSLHTGYLMIVHSGHTSARTRLRSSTADKFHGPQAVLEGTILNSESIASFNSV